MKKEIKQVFEFARAEEIIEHGDANKLLAIVMRLTKCSVSPALVMAAIEDAKLAEGYWVVEVRGCGLEVAEVRERSHGVDKVYVFCGDEVERPVKDADVRFVKRLDLKNVVVTLSSPERTRPTE